MFLDHCAKERDPPLSDIGRVYEAGCFRSYNRYVGCHFNVIIYIYMLGFFNKGQQIFSVMIDTGQSA